MPVLKSLLIKKKIMYLTNSKIKSITGEQFFNVGTSIALIVDAKIDQTKYPERYTPADLEKHDRDAAAIFRIADDQKMPFKMQNEIMQAVRETYEIERRYLLFNFKNLENERIKF